LWDVPTGQSVLELTNTNKQEVTSVAFSPDGNWLAMGDSVGIRLWDARPLPLSQGEELEYRLWATRSVAK
jgi:WD40 repeat protein